MEKVLTKSEIAVVLNEWMRRYIEEPDKFSREFEAINLFLSEDGRGVKPSYGDTCAEYMIKLNYEIEMIRER